MNKRIYCSVCGKQAVNREVSPNEPHITTLYGAISDFRNDRCFCVYCAKYLDENGLFPEERAKADLEAGLEE
jgi:hypothetical protein